LFDADVDPVSVAVAVSLAGSKGAGPLAVPVRLAVDALVDSSRRATAAAIAVSTCNPLR
jgi:hypothetical protein